MEACTKGKVISTNRLWWLKINKKPIRTHLLDGADFPTVITVQYSVSGVNYKKRKFIGVGTNCAQLLTHGMQTVHRESVTQQTGTANL